MRIADLLAHSPLTLGMTPNTAFEQIPQKVTRRGNKRQVWGKQTQQLIPIGERQMSRQEPWTQGAGTGNQQALVSIWAMMLRNRTGSYAKFVKERKLR